MENKLEKQTFLELIPKTYDLNDRSKFLPPSYNKETKKAISFPELADNEYIDFFNYISVKGNDYKATDILVKE